MSNTYSFSDGTHFGLVISTIFFEFEDLEDDQYRVYRTYRDGLYRAAQRQVPHPALSAIPRASDKKFGPFIRMGSMSKGAFGWVYAGVDTCTGEPLAIKEHSAKNRNESECVVAEIGIGKMFSVSTPGHLDQILSTDPRTEYNRPTSNYPRFLRTL